MKGLNLIYSLLLLMLLGSCKQQEQPWEKEENQAKVNLVLSLLEEKSTRSNVSDYPKDPTQWSYAEMLADGRYFEYITVLILKGNVLQAYEHLDVTNKASQAVIEFDRTFTTGTYTLMAVANYTDLNDFTTLLNGFINGTRSYNDLIAYKLQAGDDGVAPQTMQPLTLIQEIDLHPGQNQISGEMLRTYSRIRIEVRNQSDTKGLFVNGISFSDNFAQKEAYIWPGKGYLPNRRVALNVASEDALTPFTQSVTIPKMTASGGSTTVNSAVIFDGYILESEETDADKKYTYTLDLSYGEGQGGGGQTTVPEGPLKDVTSIRNYSSNTFLIQNVYSGNFLYKSDYYSHVIQGSNTYENLQSGGDTKYLWELESYGTGEDCYRIRNVGSGNYIGTVVSSGAYVFFSETPDSHYFKFHNHTITSNDSESQGIQMQYQGTGTTTFLYNYNSMFFVGGSMDVARTKFVFYCIGNSDSNSGSDSDSNTNINKTQTIDLRTINKETARPEDVRNIKRNDFINTLVTVTYNETFGLFEFEVEDWTQGGGDITFN